MIIIYSSDIKITFEELLRNLFSFSHLRGKMAELRGMWRQQVFFPFKIFILKAFSCFFVLESSFCRGTFSSNQNVLLKMRLISRDGKRMERSGPAVEGIFQSVWHLSSLFLSIFSQQQKQSCFLPNCTFHSFSSCSPM